MIKKEIENILENSYSRDNIKYFCLYNELKNSKKKIDKRVWNYLNADSITVLVDERSKRFWFEKTWSGIVLHDYIVKYYTNLLAKINIKYLYD